MQDSASVFLNPFAFLRLDSIEQEKTPDDLQGKQNLDPLERLCDVYELIFQHLNGEEVKKASEVSSTWYKKIGSSRTCMNKIILKFVIVSTASPSLEEINAILASQRKYANFEFSRPFFCNDKKSTKALKKFSDSVVNLKLSWAVGSVIDGIFDEPVAFPQLKTLIIGRDVSVKLMENLFTKSKLEQLALITITPKLLQMVLAIPTLRSLQVLRAEGPTHSYQHATFPDNSPIIVLTIKGGFSTKLKFVLALLRNLKKLYYSGRDIQAVNQFLYDASVNGYHQDKVDLIQYFE
jgi:hypothetical protein